MRKINTKHFVLTLVLLIASNYIYAENMSKIDLKNPLNYYPEFIGKTIQIDDNIIALDLPKRAEDAAFVPLKINTGYAQKDLFIKKIWVFVDNNPVPLVALFEFGVASEHADLAFKIRIHKHSWVRAIALTEDNKLYQASYFVKASGGCSVPIGSDIKSARERLGEIRLNINQPHSKLNSTLVNVKIRHINLTGMQMNQVTRLSELAHYIKNIKISLDNKIVLLAKTSISVSEDPDFHFYTANSKNKRLKIEVLDTEGLKFTDDFSM